MEIVKPQGVDIDEHTRCTHYNTSKDIIAIKFRCCKLFFSCFQCHKELMDHEPIKWSVDQFDQKAILCGVCDIQLSISEYFSSDHQCPSCQTDFNPNCSNHYHLYFEDTDIYPVND